MYDGGFVVINLQGKLYLIWSISGEIAQSYFVFWQVIQNKTSEKYGVNYLVYNELSTTLEEIFRVR